MTNYKPYINALRECAKEHENDITPFAHIRVSDLCRDTANLLEELDQEPRIDFEELKRKILMEVDGGTDEAWLAYGDVCTRISNSIDEFVSDMRGKEE